MNDKNKLTEFKCSMEPAKEIYTNELKSFAKRYDFLGDLSLKEEPDIDTQDYIYSFDKLNGTSESTLDSTLKELYEHMRKFSKTNGIDAYCRNATIRFNR